MAQTIQLKRSSVAGNLPTSSDLALGEIAINTADGAVYIKKGNNDIVAVADNDILHIDTTNSRIGIGTTSPSKSLHVYHATTDYVALFQSGDNQAGIVFQDATSSAAIKTQNGRLELIADSSADVAGSAIVFRIDSLNSGEVGRFDVNGRLGIGTTSPGVHLDIESSTNNAQIELTATDGTDQSYGIFGATGNNSNGAGFYIQDKTASGSPVRLKIDSTGNVGIGTTTPAHNLQVKTSTNGQGIIIQRDSTTEGTYAQLSFSNSTNDAYATPNMWIRGNRGSNYSTSFLTIGTGGNTGSERIRIDSSGNVGIGTTSPTVPLDVFSSGTTQAKFTRDLSTDVGLTIGNDSAGVVFGTVGVHHFQFYANSGKRLNISGTGAITFNNAYTFPTSDGSANQVLQTDGSGNLSFATVSGGGSSNSITDADGDTKIQVEETTDDDIIRFDTGGTERAVISSNGLNVKSGAIRIAGTDVITSGRNLVNIGTITSGKIEGTTADANGHILKTDSSTASASDVVLQLRNSSSDYNLKFQPRLPAGNMHAGVNADDFGIFTSNSKGISIGNNDKSLVVIHPTDGIEFHTNNTNRFNITTAGNLQLNGTTVIDASRNLTNIGTISSGTITTSGNIDLNGGFLIDVEQINGVGASGWLDFNMDTDSVYPQSTTDNQTVLGSVTHMNFVGDSNANGTGGIFNFGYGVGNTDSGTFTRTATLNRSGNLDVIGSITSGTDITLADNLKATGNNLKLFAGGNHIINMDLNGNFYPQTHNAVDLGFSDSLAFRNLHLVGAITGGATISSGAITTTGHIQQNNAQELRGKDTSGNVKTLVRVNSSNELEYGWSGNGKVKIMGGGSYTERFSIGTDGNTTITGNLTLSSNSDYIATRQILARDTNGLSFKTSGGGTTMFYTNAGDVTVSNNLTVSGNLTVNGTTTTLNTATLDVEDKNITLNKGSGDTSGSANGAGITIQDAVDASNDATILWDATNDEFDFSHGITSVGLVSTGTTTDNSASSIIAKNSSGATLFNARNDGVVLIPNNYLFVNSSQGAYITGSLRARGGITNDSGNNLSINSSGGDVEFNNTNLNNITNIRLKGHLLIDSGGFVPSDAEGQEFKYYLVGQGTDQNYKKVADVTISTGSYKSLAMRVVLESQSGNFGNTTAVDKTEYICIFYRSGAVQDDGDTAEISGQDPTFHNLRIVKTATGVYELQVRQNANYRDAILKLEVLSTNGGSITITDGNVNGSTSGTIVTPSSSNTRSTYSFNKVDTPFLNIQNNIQVNSTEILDASRNLSNIGTIGSGAITSTGTSTFGVVTSASYKVGATTVIDNSRNLTNIGTISSGTITTSGNLVKSGSGDLTIDVGGRIDLSADDNGEVRLYDGSSLYGQFKDDDDRFSIQGLKQDKDMLFVVNDGGVMTTALKLDAADGGDATFYGTITASGDITSADRIISKEASGGFYKLHTDGTFRAAFYDDNSNTAIYADGDGSNPFITFSGGATHTTDIDGILNLSNTNASLRIGGTEVISTGRNIANVGSISASSLSTSGDIISSQFILSKVYGFANTGSSSDQYIKFGTISGLAQDGRSLTLRITSNSGYNAASSQNQDTIVRFKTSNNNSNNSGFYGDCQIYRFGEKSNAPSDVIVKQVSTTEFEFYGKFANFTGAGSFYVVEHRFGTWTHDGTNTGSTAPSGTTITATARQIFVSGTNNASASLSAGDITSSGNVNLTSGSLQIGGTTVIESSRNLNNIGDITSTGNASITGSGSSGNAFRVNRGSDGSQALRIENSGEVVVANNYLYASHTGTAFYSQGQAVFRGGITNDGSNALSISSGASHINFNSKHLESVGNIVSTGRATFTSDYSSTNSTLNLLASTNGAGAGIAFSDNGTPSTTSNQRGHLTFYHGDSQSFGSGASFRFETSESTLSVLVDGKLLVKDGILMKPSSGTGAGTQILDSSRNLTNINRITTADGINDAGSAGSSTIFNESGSTADFRIESDSNTHMFFLDGGNNAIGINESSPRGDLDVNGELYVRAGYATNYADSSGWVKDTDGFSSQTGYYGGAFSCNGSASEQSMDYGTAPDGTQALIWTATADTSNNADGGWNKDITGLRDDATYMSVVYVRRNGTSTTGNFYHGTHGSHTLNLDGSANTNPYFTTSNISDLPQDVWCVSIGFIRANNNSSTSQDSVGGLYRTDTGERIRDYTTFKMKDGSTTQRHRTYLYYSTSGNSSLSWFKPGFYEVNGAEPTVRDLVNPGMNQGTTFNGNVNMGEQGSGTVRRLHFVNAHDKQKIGLYGPAGTGAEWIGTSAATLELSGSSINFNGGSGSGTPNLKHGGTTIMDTTRNMSNIGTINSGAITSSGDILAPGIYVGSANTSYDFYNNGTSYFNGTVNVDATLALTTQRISGVKSLQFGNMELTDMNGAYQMVLDANDSGTDVPVHGDVSGSYPLGIYFTGDNGNATTTIGSGLAKVWHTGHFKKAHIDYFVGLYNTGVTTTEYDYLDGVTSNIQTQLNAKQGTLSGSTNITVGTINSGAITSSGSVYAASGSNQSELTNVGSLELTRSAANAFIDFKSSTSEDYDCRIQQSGNGLIFQTGGNGSTATGLTIDSSRNATFAGSVTFQSNLTSSAGSVFGHGFVDGSRGFNFESGNTSVATIRFDADTMRFWSGGSGGGSEKIRLNDDANNSGRTQFFDGIDVGHGSGAGTHTHGIFTGTASRGLHLRTRSDIAGGQHSGCAEVYSADTEGSGGELALSNTNGVNLFIDGAGLTGIGTTSPTHRLHVNSASTNIVARFESTDTAAIIQIKDSTGTAAIESRNDFRFKVSTSTENMRLTTGGALHVEGDVTAFSTTVSDERLKDDVVSIDSALDKVMKLRGVEYIWNKGSRKGQKDLGVIAQEVEKVLPEIVKDTEMVLLDEEIYKTVDYEKLTAVLIEAVKEQQEEIEKLKEHSHPAKDMSEMKGYEELVARINKLENKNGNN